MPAMGMQLLIQMDPLLTPPMQGSQDMTHSHTV